MKKFLSVVLFVGMLVWSGTAMAVAMAMPWDDLNSSWVVSGSMDYWTATDLTSSEDGDSMFQITMEQASYESAFGLYTVNASGGDVSKFEIFARTDEPTTEASDATNVSFWNDSGVWKVTTSYIDNDTLSDDNWVIFDSQFGFYYDVYTTSDSDSYYTFFTDNALNTEEDGEEHIMTAYNANNNWLYVYLDDEIGDGDGDFTDMTVFANDVAPVPEPTTLLLLGSGLLGLAFLKRRKS